MVNLRVINNILNNLYAFQKKLAILAALDEADFLKDFTKIESAKHLLQVSIQSCIDLAHHIIADEGYRSSQSSYDAFLVLNEEGILPTDFLPTLQQMVGFRNRVVHLYWDVDDALLYTILQQSLLDFDTYISHILAFINEQTQAS